jgi:hypothetical protein
METAICAAVSERLEVVLPDGTSLPAARMSRPLPATS